LSTSFERGFGTIPDAVAVRAAALSVSLRLFGRLLFPLFPLWYFYFSFLDLYAYF
jgi:hypothetical protein